jgi:hypothetical protein
MTARLTSVFSSRLAPLPDVANVSAVTGVDQAEAYVSNRPDRPRSFTAAAWACRGTRPTGT